MPKPSNTKTQEEQDSDEQCQGIEQAIIRFEKIMMSRIYVQQRLGDRLKLSIRTGMLVLFLLAIAILLLLVTLSVQISRVADVTDNMDANFLIIAKNMQVIDKYMGLMEKQVAYLPKIKGKTAIIDEQMKLMNQNLFAIKNEVQEMTGNITKVRSKMSTISITVKEMDGQVGFMSGQVHRMSKPANTINKMMPF